jgi:hypothetical protein
MGKITLGGAMPPDNNNGLTAHSEDFLNEYKPGEPLKIYNVVARVSVDKITTKTVDGVTYPTLKIDHWELVPVKHQAAFGEIIGDAFGERTGMLEPEQLPFPDGTKPLSELDPFPEEVDLTATAGEPADLTAHRARGRS